jgi:hypothetical protein
MPRHDAYHEVVKNALKKDGWDITHDPYVITIGRKRFSADLGAERSIAAQRGSEKIFVEIKVFGGDSFINDLHRATGQYGNYRSLVRRLNPERSIWLAVSEAIYEDQFTEPMVQMIVEDQQILLLVFDPEREEIVGWIT